MIMMILQVIMIKYSFIMPVIVIHIFSDNYKNSFYLYSFYCYH